MGVRAPVGDLNLAYEDCCIGRGLAAISCDYPSYCFYLMRSLRKNSMLTTAKVQSLDQSAEKH